MARPKYETMVKPRLAEITELVSKQVQFKEIYKVLGISSSAFCEYVNTHEEMAEAIKEGERQQAGAFEEALREAAVGGEYEEVTKELKGGELVVTKVVKKKVLPNAVAVIFGLKNLNPEKYKDRQEVDVGQSKPFEVNIKVVE